MACSPTAGTVRRPDLARRPTAHPPNSQGKSGQFPVRTSGATLQSPAQRPGSSQSSLGQAVLSALVLSAPRCRRPGDRVGSRVGVQVYLSCRLNRASGSSVTSRRPDLALAALVAPDASPRPGDGRFPRPPGLLRATRHADAPLCRGRAHGTRSHRHGLPELMAALRAVFAALTLLRVGAAVAGVVRCCSTCCGS
jgi:hypothetical protein